MADIYGQPRQLNFSQSNEQQYNDVVAGYGAMTDKYWGQVYRTVDQYEDLYNQQRDYGGSQRAQLSRDYARQVAEMQQSMVSRGLGNTSALDSAKRGMFYDRAVAGLTIEDQLMNRQLGIKQNQLNYQQGAQQYGASLAGQGLSYQGTFQQNRQAQDVQMAMAYDQQMQAWNQQQSQQGWQTNMAREGYANQQYMQQQQFNNQDYIQRTYGFYRGGGYVVPRNFSQGGPVGGPIGAGDVIPARLTPGEFVLSPEMVADLKSGKMTANDLMRLLHQPAGAPPAAMPMNPYRGF